MVHTRSLEGSSSHERETRVHLKQQMSGNGRMTRHVRRILNDFISSSSSSEGESTTLAELQNSMQQHGRYFAEQTTRISLQSHASENFNEESRINNSSESTCSETQILIDTKQLECIPHNEEFSVPLEMIQSTIQEISVPETSPSLLPTKEPKLEKITENEEELSFDDDMSTEENCELVKEKPRVKKLTRTRQKNKKCQKKSSDSDLNDFDVEIVRKNQELYLKKRKTIFRQARLSSQVIKETPTAEFETEEELSLSDEYTSSEGNSAFGETVQSFKGLLREKLLQKRQTNTQSQMELSGNDSSDSEIEKQTRKKREQPARTVCLPWKSRKYEPSSKRTSRKDSSIERAGSTDRRVTRFSVQNEINKKTRDDSQMKLTSSNHVQNVTSRKNNSEERSSSRDRKVTRRSTSIQKQINEETPMKTTPNKNYFLLQNFKVTVTRAEFTPEFLCLRKSEELRRSMSVASCSNTNQISSQNETNGKNVEFYQKIEDLLRDLEGSSDSEEEKKRNKSPVKQKRELRPKTKPQQSKPTDTNKQYICHVCDQSFNSKESLRSHEDLHSGNKKRKCKQCDETFTRNDNYVNHLRKHNIDLKSHDVNAFKCDICRKLFAYRHVLRRHQLMHENRADFKCKKCGEKFIRKDYLKSHERLKHSKNSHFTCRVCKKKFAYKHSKIIHERLHTKEKPYKCHICRAAFIRKDYLKKHTISHEIKRAKFICDDCDEAFVNKLSLQIHVQNHLKKKKEPTIHVR